MTEDLHTPIGLLAFFVFSAVQIWTGLLKVYVWRRRVADVETYNARLLAAPNDETRKRLETTPPDPPPSLGLIMLVLGTGALYALLASEVRGEFQIAEHWLGSAGAALAKAGPVDRVCNGSNDCGAGCSCDRGECKCAADRPTAPPPQRQKRRVALSEGTLCADCQALPWFTTEIETFAVVR